MEYYLQDFQSNWIYEIPVKFLQSFNLISEMLYNFFEQYIKILLREDFWLHNNMKDGTIITNCLIGRRISCKS